MMAQMVFPGIYEREIPLKGNPLKGIHIYVVKSKDRAMIVDTGFHTEEIVAEMEDYIRELDLDLSKTILFLTHLHSDHTGLASWFSKQGVPIYLSAVDGERLVSMCDAEGVHWSQMKHNALLQGLAVDGLAIEDHPGFRYRPKEPFPYTAMHTGDRLDVGDFSFVCIDESGHTPGMLGLYEEEKKILICGDHILGKITPNITHWGFDVGDSLGTYLENLEKVKELPIELLLSSHRHLVEDIPARVEELKRHHAARLQEVRDILKDKKTVTVRDVTKDLHWDIRAKDWEDFPKSQKWFAAGEAQAHLEHLRALGEVKMEERDGLLWYTLVD